MNFKWRGIVLAGAILAAFVVAVDAPAAGGKKYLGGTVCDFLARQVWGSYWATLDPVTELRDNGFDWCRAWVTTVSSDSLGTTPFEQWSSLPWRDEYWSSLEYTEQILKKAAGAGMRLNLVFFLSDKQAHAGVQDAPAEWVGLSVEDTAIVLRSYCYQATKYFKDKGYHIELYDIGNEIERGILNFRPGDRIYLPAGVDQTTDMDYMRNNVWNVEAVLLKAAIAGVKEADPDASIVLHAGGVGLYPDNLLIRSFLEDMIFEGVDYDYAGLSYPYLFNADDFPQPYFRSQEWRELLDYLAALGKPVLVSEFSYPHDSAGLGGAADPGYPFTPEGQRAWVADFLSSCLDNNAIAGAFYWYADYCPGMGGAELESSGLFASDTQAESALAEFSPGTLYRGDVNGDYVVNILDAVRCLRMAVGLETMDSAADVNGDGAVDISDLFFILRRALGVR